MDVVIVRFRVEATQDGGYIARCDAIGAGVEAESIPDLLAKMKAMAQSLSDPDRQTSVVVRPVVADTGRVKPS
jgi:hypothetical protein